MSGFNFKIVNKKILFYFILFFLLVALFSISLFYMNKNLILDLNQESLQEVNSACARSIDLFLKNKKKLLANYYPAFKKEYLRNPVHFLKNYHPVTSDFVSLELIYSGKSYIIYTDSMIQSDYHNFPVVTYVSAEKNQLIGWLNPGEMKDLLKSNEEKTKHFIYFPGRTHKLGSEGYKMYKLPGNLFSDNTGFNENISGLDGEPISGILSTFSYIKEFNLIVISQREMKGLYEKLSSIGNIIFIVNIIFLVIFLLLTFSYMLDITDPIKRLTRAVQNFRKGNLDYKINIKTIDRIQTLVKEFELMRQNLLESYQGLEDRIKSRTQELQEAQAQISHQEKMASLGLMAAGIAHEIGNPLTSISSMAQIIKRKNVDPKINEYIKDILKHIDRISQIVRELVDFSRPAINEANLININDVIKSAVAIIKYDRRAKHVDFSLKLDEDIPKTVLVSDQLLQVLLNVLINALDALESYGNQIKVISGSYDNRIKIDIVDQGCGIPNDKLNKIFEPFYTTKGAGRGTGLGLTVSYGIIKRLSGEIKVKSELEKGSTFSVILPIVESK
jgi:signal transduction histidine kinase